MQYRSHSGAPGLTPELQEVQILRLKAQNIVDLKGCDGSSAFPTSDLSENSYPSSRLCLFTVERGAPRVCARAGNPLAKCTLPTLRHDIYLKIVKVSDSSNFHESYSLHMKICQKQMSQRAVTVECAAPLLGKEDEISGRLADLVQSSPIPPRFVFRPRVLPCPAERSGPLTRPELLALLAAVKDDPDDDTPRLVVADWLEEYGDKADRALRWLVRPISAGCVTSTSARMASATRGSSPWQTLRFWLMFRRSGCGITGSRIGVSKPSWVHPGPV
jgi:uncharacterized protein (TIGR02996 family)